MFFKHKCKVYPGDMLSRNLFAVPPSPSAALGYRPLAPAPATRREAPPSSASFQYVVDKEAVKKGQP